ncbi:MAG: hypothetical protein HS116_08650 [Planctomycetes bacterium]|nr:hypothetical protein [Planctomycetota bacterium]
MRNQAKWAWVFLGTVLAVPAVAAADAEVELRNEFAAGYNNAPPAARLEAVQKLKGVSEQASLQMLYKVAAMDQDIEVRKSAFKLMCACPDKDGFVARLAALTFKNEKDRDAKKEMAAELSTLKFRYDALEAFAHYMTTLRYPPLPDDSNRNNQNNYGMGSSTTNREVAAATRKYFEELLVTFNAAAGSTFKAAYDTPTDIKKWWPTKAVEFQKLDHEARQQVAAAPKLEAGK